MARDFLSEIVEQKKAEVASAKQRVSQTVLQQEAQVPRHRRPFMQRLENPGPSGLNIIAEIKRASPSKGVFCPNLDPVGYASEYERGGAAALSVLTDRNYFQGSVGDLKKARAATALPVLRKDFLISSYQIYESAAMGTDAVLLIVRILEKKQLKDYLDLCDDLGLDALVEVNSEKELETATEAGARLIGINNRDLKSFHTDIQTAISIVSLFEPHQIAVAASGIGSRKDIEANLSAGIWNFLIGESLVRAENPRAFLESLRGAKIDHIQPSGRPEKQPV